MGKFWRILKRGMRRSAERIRIYAEIALFSSLIVGLPTSIIIAIFSMIFQQNMLYAIAPIAGFIGFWSACAFVESLLVIFGTIYSTLFEDEIDWRAEEYLELRNLQKHVS